MQIWAQKIIPQHGVSRWLGRLAYCRISWLKNFLIGWFVRHYQVNMSEAEQSDYRQYEHFNAFFTRALKADARPQPADPQAVACPVDGAISELGAIADQQIFQAKGHHYQLSELLAGDETMATQFTDGAFLTAYLSPRDYHRVHMPVTASLQKMVHVPGQLFSVNPNTVAQVPSLFARNERVICYFESAYGPMAMIMVGAIVVASIATVWHGLVTPPAQQTVQHWDYQRQPIQLDRGEEMGHFAVGSTIILLFGKEAVQWQPNLKAGGSLRLGQVIAGVSAF